MRGWKMANVLSGPRGLWKQAKDAILLSRSRRGLIAFIEIYSCAPYLRHSLLIWKQHRWDPWITIANRAQRETQSYWGWGCREAIGPGIQNHFTCSSGADHAISNLHAVYMILHCLKFIPLPLATWSVSQSFFKVYLISFFFYCTSVE